MAEGNNSSANTAILAIFVIVILLGLGFLFLRGTGGKKTEIDVNLPKVSQGSGGQSGSGG